MPSYLVLQIESLIDSKLPADRLEHVRRVRSTAMKMANSEGLGGEELEVVELASLLHDSAFMQQTDVLDHSMVSSRIARETLLQFELPVALVDRICHCVESHSVYSAVKPQSREAKIVFDANSLELLGPLGILRIGMMTRDSEDKSIISSVHKLRALGARNFESLHTAYAKKIGKKYWEYEQQFLEKLEEQLGDA